MLRLSSASEPHWLEILPGVRFQVRPASVASILIAREAASKVLTGDEVEDATQLANVAFVRAMAQRAVIAWEGIGDLDGEPLPVTTENIDQAMNVWRVFEGFDRTYVGPALAAGEEKNGSSSSPNGTSPPATTAPAAAKPAPSAPAS